MATYSHSRPSFSPYLKWGIGLHVVVLILVVLSVVVMVNYLSRDYFLRFHLSTRTRIELFPRTVGLLRSLTNQVKVTLYYDTNDELYQTVADLLSEYRLVNPKITVATVDYLRDPPGASEKVKATYKLFAPTDKNLVIFDCEGKIKSIPGNALAQYVLEQAPNEKEREFRRKPIAFLGETAFTMALLDVTSPPLKACFLQGHGEHQINSGDERDGYLKFASILQQNHIQIEPLSLLGANLVPMDCNLLVIAGPRETLPDPELDKIEQYLNQGGRLLALFNCYPLYSPNKDTGLERILAKWGVDVGHNIIKDPVRTSSGQDVVVGNFGKHPIVNSLLGSALDLMLPRSVGQLKGRSQAADAPRVEELAFSGPSASASGDLMRKPPFSLMVAVEKGAIKDVITERGSTRMVVMGDSIFLANHYIDALANRDFAGCAVNWLLERTQLLEGLGPRPIEEHRIVMTRAQLHQAQWVLLAGLPGSALFLGGLVWLRRRK
jgi:hypothetical protein